MIYLARLGLIVLLATGGIKKQYRWIALVFLIVDLYLVGTRHEKLRRVRACIAEARADEATITKNVKAIQAEYHAVHLQTDSRFRQIYERIQKEIEVEVKHRRSQSQQENING